MSSTNGATIPKLVRPHSTCGWTWSLAKDDGIVFRPTARPNRFHRFMQRVFLGIIWTKD